MRKLLAVVTSLSACLGVAVMLAACGGGGEETVVDEPVTETEVEAVTETDVETDSPSAAPEEDEEAGPPAPKPGDSIRLDNGKQVEVADPDDQGSCEPGRVEQSDGQCLPNQPSG